MSCIGKVRSNYIPGKRSKIRLPLSYDQHALPPNICRSRPPDWYEEQKPGLGKEFLTAVDVVLTQIELNPLLFAQIYKQKHRAVVSLFPYNIIYAVEGDLIRVSAIIHGKQNPKKWTKRK